MPGGGRNIYSSGQSANTRTEPYDALRPFLERGFGEARQNVLNRPLEYFPDATYTPFAPESEAAISARTGRAVQGNPLNQAAQQQALGTLTGGFQPGGGNFQNYIDSVISEVAPQVDATFAGSGRFGSPLHTEALSRGVSRGIAPGILDTYNQERQRQVGAAFGAPGLAQQDYADIDQLRTAGAEREALYGQALQDQINRFGFAQEEPYNRIARYMGLLQPGLGFSEGATTQYNNPNALLTSINTFGPLIAAAFASSRHFKENGRPVDVLEKLDTVPVEEWNYKGDKERHIGPYAEDFRDTFGVGNGVTINPVDALGICLQAIKELHKEIKELKESKNA